MVRRLFDGTFTGLRCRDGAAIAKGFLFLCRSFCFLAVLMMLLGLAESMTLDVAAG